LNEGDKESEARSLASDLKNKSGSEKRIYCMDLVAVEEEKEYNRIILLATEEAKRRMELKAYKNLKREEFLSAKY